MNAHIRALLEERDDADAVDGDDSIDGGALLEEFGNATFKYIGDGATAKGVGAENLKVGGIIGQRGGIKLETVKLNDATEEALKTALEQARKVVDAAQKALDTYKSIHGRSSDSLLSALAKGSVRMYGIGSRELSGEMGGDTIENLLRRG